LRTISNSNLHTVFKNVMSLRCESRNIQCFTRRRAFTFQP
jgi:hypothetical protein